MNNSDGTPDLQALQFELAGIKKTIEVEKEVVALERDLRKEIASLRKEFSDLKTEFKTDSNFYRWVGSTGVFVAVLFSIIGIAQWHDVLGKLRLKGEQTSEYQSNLARGLALANGNRPQNALTYLRKCYAITPEDEAVAGALLWSLEEGDDWERATPIATKLMNDSGIDKIQDPWIINNIGRSLLYQGQDNVNKLDQAGLYLERAAANLKGDPEERDVLINLWVYYLFKGDTMKAEASLKQATEASSSKGNWKRDDWSAKLIGVCSINLSGETPR